MKIEKLQNCSGCSACYSACPKNAIEMKPNFEGFLYPVINSEICIKCGKCEKVCPVLGSCKKNKEDISPDAFAVINNDEKIRLESSSGGVFTAIAKEVIEQNGVVFGVKLDKNQVAVHSFTETLDGLSEFRGSKYVQSDVGNSFSNCKDFLDSGRKVLFSGTPCQIEGLKNFLAKEYENLVCVDFICHGVPSPKLWKKYVELHEKKSASRIVKTAFRRKNDGWKQYSLSFTFANDSEYCASLKKDPYLQLFLKNVCLRESCYNCSAKKINRVSDITIADFWGIQKELPEMDDDKGISFIIVHTNFGKKIISDLINCTKISVKQESGIKYNPAVNHNAYRSKKRNNFYFDLDSIEFDKLIDKYTNLSLNEKFFLFIRRCIGKIKRMITR